MPCLFPTSRRWQMTFLIISAILLMSINFLMVHHVHIAISITFNDTDTLMTLPSPSDYLGGTLPSMSDYLGNPSDYLGTLPNPSDYLSASKQQDTRKEPQDGDLFAPGSLPLKRVETFRKCYLDPTKYQRHFVTAHCSIADKWKLVYHLLPKSGSSTGRVVMKDSFGAHEKQVCRDDLVEHSKKNTTFHHFVSVREPLNRFYASYEEMFVRRLGKLKEIPKPYQKFMKAYKNWEYKQYEHLFNTPEGVEQLTRTFEEFVNDFDYFTPFDAHLRLQMAALVNPSTGQAFKLDGIVETHDLDAQFAELAKKVKAPPPKVIRGRSYPRRFNVSDVHEDAIRKICQFTAIDFCCLNFALPPICAEAIGDELVQCRWTSKPELSEELMIEAVSPFPAYGKMS